MRIKALKWLGAALAAVLPGAIGSGLWETLLKPSLHLAPDLVVRVFGLISQSFKDSVYREAAQGFHEKHSLTVLVSVNGVVAGFMAGFLSSFIWRKPGGSKPEAVEDAGGTTYKKMSPQRMLAAFAVVVGFLSWFAFAALRDLYVNRVTTWSLTSIERVGGLLIPENIPV